MERTAELVDCAVALRYRLLRLADWRAENDVCTQKSRSINDSTARLDDRHSFDVV